MRKAFFRRIAVCLVVLATVLPASAAPKRDDGQPGLIQRFVRLIQKVKHIVPLDTIDLNVPKP
jgi:hypothetical protein